MILGTTYLASSTRDVFYSLRSQKTIKWPSGLRPSSILSPPCFLYLFIDMLLLIYYLCK